MTRIEECILYRDFEKGEILRQMAGIIEAVSKKKETDHLRGAYYTCLNGLVEMAAAYGFSGNLWHNYLTYLLVNKENAFSTACEIVGHVEGSVNQMARHDFVRFKELYDFDITALDAAFDSKDSAIIGDYRSTVGAKTLYNEKIRDRICALSCRLEACANVDEFTDDIVQFYADFGVGKLGLNKAFRVAHTEHTVRIEPITNIAYVELDDLVGYENAKKKLIDNTEAFVRGRPSNNCLLFGDAGTGKSSSIKAILNQYYDQGLRMIEIYKHQFQDLNDVIAQIKNRNYKFIIYMDDLSFEEFEIEYKYLKAVIEGGLEKKPDNILIYATSNRRHLIKESFQDKEGRRDQLHASDTVQEKLSLVNRFGVTIFFSSPNKKEFQNIVMTLAKRSGVAMPEDKLLLAANQWEMAHGGLSGRTAQQFIDYLLGQEPR